MHRPKETNQQQLQEDRVEVRKLPAEEDKPEIRGPESWQEHAPHLKLLASHQFHTPSISPVMLTPFSVNSYKTMLDVNVGYVLFINTLF